MRTFASLYILLITAGFSVMDAQQNHDSWANINRYAKSNVQLKQENKKIKAVFIGNSITDVWGAHYPDYFKENNYVARGIGGQTTPQFLSRFRADVVELKPEIVVINGAINDIAENTGTYDQEFTLGNIKSMCEIAQANGITVILTSTLPASHIPWNDKIQHVPQKVIELNKAIKAYADSKKISYLDYYSQMVNAKGGLKEEYTSDAVHLTDAGYRIMKDLAKKAIESMK